MAKLIAFFLLKLFLLCFLPGSNAVYDVVSFGAKSGGKTDSAKAFLRAWTAACRSSSPATLRVPAGSFLLSQASFHGPCKNTAIKFSIHGTIVAPSNYRKFAASEEWIEFKDVEGVTISGGKLDGRGADLWTCKRDGHGRRCPRGATVSISIGST